jgi:hypothetical protein
MSFEEHLKYPTANCLIQSDYELANEVADFIKQTKIEEEQDASKLLRH